MTISDKTSISGTISGMMLGTMCSFKFDFWCLWQDRSNRILSCTSPQPRPRQWFGWWTPYRWGWMLWYCWSRAFTIPYSDWGAGTNRTVLVGYVWLYGRCQRKSAEGPSIWCTCCFYTRPTTTWHQHPWSNLVSSANILYYIIPNILSYTLILYTISGTI